MAVFKHPKLGQIRGVELGHDLTQFRSLPYASIRQRFARATILDRLSTGEDRDIYDARKIGPCSIQPFDAAKLDAVSNQLPEDIIEGDQEQDEDCLRATITLPTSYVRETTNEHAQRLPVMVFLHGGAFFLNSGERPYYSPDVLLAQALAEDSPFIFVSINYRLGTLGFMHSQRAPDLIPANNGLHDQIRAFEWIKQNIPGFGGDATNVTAIGQSAGGESLSLHNISGQTMPLYTRSIALAGTPVTMPAKTPSEHEHNFRVQAQKLGIDTGSDRTSQDIANDLINNVDVENIRDLNFVGAPCTSSEILPYARPTMELSASGPDSTVDWLESQIVSAAGYDGSISWIITKKNSKRKGHAKSFCSIATEVLGEKLADSLCELYEIDKNAGLDRDDDTLTKICQFESDIGFIRAAEAVCEGFTKKGVRTYLQLYDLPNPFEGYLEAKKYTTHTWDIVSLLGPYDERLDEDYLRVIRAWRSKIIQYCVTGELPWSAFQEGRAMLVDRTGLDCRDVDTLPGAERRRKLAQLAREAKGEAGHDLLWESLCRRWLDKGE